MGFPRPHPPIRKDNPEGAPSPFSSVLVVLTGSLGDIIRGFPIASELKRHSPNCQLTWLVEDKWSEVLQLQEAIDHVLVFRRRDGLRGIREIRKLLRESHFDITLDLQRHFKSGIFSYWSGSTRRIGFHPKDAKEMNWLLNNEHIPHHGESFSKLQHYLEFLRYLGIDYHDTQLDFGIKKDLVRESLPQQLRDFPDPWNVFVLGSSWQSKNWFVSGYVELARQLIDQGEKGIVLVGDGSQMTIANGIVDALSDGKIINLVAQTSLLELAAVLEGASVCVGPDSGPGHLSAALKTPYVTLFGPTAPERVVPWGCENLVVRASLACSPCLRRTCPGLNRLCMRLIQPGAVLRMTERAKTLSARAGGG